MTNPTNKWIISAWTVVAAIFVFNPLSFKLTNILTVLSPSLATMKSYGPTIFGYILHSVILFFIIRIMMEYKLPGLKK